jgi:hypothetical protein
VVSVRVARHGRSVAVRQCRPLKISSTETATNAMDKNR